MFSNKVHVHPIGPARRGPKVHDDWRCIICGTSTKTQKKFIKCQASNSPGGHLCELCVSKLPNDCVANTCDDWVSLLIKNEMCHICLKVDKDKECHECVICAKPTCKPCTLPESYNLAIWTGKETFICKSCVHADDTTIPLNAPSNYCILCMDAHPNNEGITLCTSPDNEVPLIDFIRNNKNRHKKPMNFKGVNHSTSVNSGEGANNAENLSLSSASVEITELISSTQISNNSSPSGAPKPLEKNSMSNNFPLSSPALAAQELTSLDISKIISEALSANLSKLSVAEANTAVPTANGTPSRCDSTFQRGNNCQNATSTSEPSADPKINTHEAVYDDSKVVNSILALSNGQLNQQAYLSSLEKKIDNLTSQMARLAAVVNKNNKESEDSNQKSVTIGTQVTDEDRKIAVEREKQYEPLNIKAVTSLVNNAVHNMSTRVENSMQKAINNASRNLITNKSGNAPVVYGNSIARHNNFMPVGNYPGYNNFHPSFPSNFLPIENTGPGHFYGTAGGVPLHSEYSHNAPSEHNYQQDNNYNNQRQTRNRSGRNNNNGRRNRR